MGITRDQPQRRFKSGKICWQPLWLTACLWAGHALAAPSISLGTNFISADPARANAYMDSGGTWNGTAEVTNTTGDRFELVVSNTAAGLPSPLSDDMAYDIGVTINVPTGFRLPSSPFTVTTLASGGDQTAGNCVAPGGGNITATQSGGAGTPITLNLVNINLPGRGTGTNPCAYTFHFGMTTRDTAPFVQEGVYSIQHSVRYALIDNGAAQAPVQANRTVEVREGDVAVLKTADTVTGAGNGETVQFTISILGSGSGGNFSTVLTDIISSDLTNLNLSIPPVPAGAAGPGANQYTFNYIAAGQRINITATAIVNVNPTAVSCPVLRNTAQVDNRIGSSHAFFDNVPFDLDNPLLVYTAPAISVPLGGSQSYVIPVQNTGDGIAKNIQLRPVNLDPGFSISLPPTETDWIWTGTAFQYVGNPQDPNDNILLAGQSVAINFNVTVTQASCPGPAGGQITWTPTYENICGTSFSPPIHFTNSSVTGVPDLDIQKTASAAALNIGENGSYSLSLSGTNLSILPSDNTDNDNEFSVQDTLPGGISNAVINTIPAGTRIYINGSITAYVAGSSIQNGASIQWRGDREDLLPVPPTLNINFTVSASACPGGQTISNAANLSYPSCAIAETDSATFVANDNPNGPVGQNISVAGSQFQTGLADSNGSAGDANEGTHMPFTVTYDFPIQSGPTAFPGQWASSVFTADLGGSALAQPLNLINSPITITIRRISTGSTLINNQTVPGGSITINPNGSMSITLDFIAVLLSDANVSDYQLQFNYTATAADPTLGGVPAVTYIETATLVLNNGPIDCSGVTTAFTQGISVSLARANITVTPTINNGNPVEVCAIVPVTFDLGSPQNSTRADNLRIHYNQSSYEFLSGETYSGELAAIANPPSPPQIDTSVSGNDVYLTVNPNTTNYTAAGSVTFNARLRSNSLSPVLNADISYDDNQTSPDIGAGESDRDFNATDNTTPQILSGQLNLTLLPPSIILTDRLTYTWTAQVANAGTGTAYNATFNTTLPTEFVPDPTTPATNCNALSISPVITGQTMRWTLGDLAPGANCDITVRGTITQNTCFQPQTNPANQITAAAEWGCGTPIVTIPTPPAPLIELPPNNLELSHDVDDSYCELCGQGEIRLTINNTGSVEVSNIDVTEDLLTSGLSYVNGSSQIRVNNGAAIAGPNPSISGTRLTWDFANIVTAVNAAAPGTFTSNGLSSAFAAVPPNPRRVEIIYRVSSPGETLIDNVRNIRAAATFDLFCSVGNSSGTGSLATSSSLFDVPLWQPVPTVIKQGRNLSAGQGSADYGATLPGLAAGDIAGGTRDNVIWRVNVQNNQPLNLDDLEDLMVQDTIGGNFVMHSICPTEAAADTSANAGTTVAPCITASGALSNTLDVDSPFGNGSGAFDVLRNSSEYIYFVGIIQNLCQNHNNTGSIQWGCETNPPGGDIGNINAGTAGTDPAADDDDIAFMSTTVNPAGLLISQTATGINTAQPVGTKGILTITVRNQSGGTVTGLQLRADLPTDYEYDNTLKTVTTTPAFASYTGMVNTATEAVTSTVTVPVFNLGSSTISPIAEHNNVLRHGDVLTLTIGIIRVNPFDTVSHPEVRVESPNSTPVANTDPDYTPATVTDDDSRITLAFDDTCPATPAFTAITNTINVNINPEDLDVNINPSDPNLLFILSDPAASLALNVIITNNGGHDARDYDTYVTVGNGINPGTLPAGCAGPVAPPAELGMPPAQPSGIMPPEYNPADSKTYRCVLSTPLAPNTSNTFAFVVQRALPFGISGDLTFRADTLGRTTRSNGSAPPGIAQPGYPYYSKDNILARIIGFNLSKRLLPNCTEDNPPPFSNDRIIIGEECTYRVEASWFGFATPGFGNIEIRNARVYEGTTANNPPPAEANPATDPPGVPPGLDGQGFMRVNTSNSSSAISVAAQNPVAPVPLSETGLSWRLNPILAAGNTEENFVSDVTFRTMNDPANTSAAPNVHGAIVTDEVNARFEVFFTATGTSLAFNETTGGYPPAGLLRASTRVIEPNVSIQKTLCNETASGTVNPANPTVAPTCGSFASTITGDSDDLYVYMLRVRNAAQTGAYQNAPAFDITVTDTMDPGDQMLIRNPATDGLDNDLDGLVDAADTSGEGTLITDSTPQNGTPERIIFTPAEVPGLLKIPAGQEIILFYRAEPQDTVVPTQMIVNSVTASYDSLPGNTGNQTVPFNPPNSGDAGGARQYNTAATNATLQILSLVVNPGSKRITRISRRDDPNGPVSNPPPPCAVPCLAAGVVIGEEIEIELEFEIPPSQLNNFILTDYLPDGLQCIEIEPISLPITDFAPGSTGPDPLFGTAQDFTTNPYNPTTGRGYACDADRVQWDFGNQSLLQVSDPSRTTYRLLAHFIARVQNVVSSQNLTVLANGGDTALPSAALGPTVVQVSYNNASGTQVSQVLSQANLTVQEPQIALIKTMEYVTPAAVVDATDIMLIRIRAQNTGTSPAYNLQILDDLSAAGMHLGYISEFPGGTNPPDSITNGNLNRPVFRYNNPLLPGASYEFTFRVRVDAMVEPQEQLDNTVHAAWAALPSNAIAINTSNSIGADGAADGMRNGALPASTDPLNDYVAQAAAAQIIPAVTITKTDLDPTVIPTIGARKPFQLRISLPEGQTENLSIRDNLAAGAVSFILENNSNYDITYQLQNISSINGQSVSGLTTSAALEAALAGFTATDSASGTVSWNFGTVVTQTEEDPATTAVNPAITITYTARIANDSGTVTGANLQNLAAADYTHGENNSTVTATASVIGPYTVVEPALRVNKTFINLPAPAPAGTVVQGTPLEYQIQVLNTGNSTAWDASITDYLPNQSDPIPPLNNRVPGGMCSNAPTITQIDINGRNLNAGTDYIATFTPAASSASLHCQFGIRLTPDASSGLTNHARIEAGETLTIRYQTQLDIGTPSGINLTNVAGASEWYSLDTDGSQAPAEIRRYSRNITLPPSANPGTVGIDDHEDAETVLTQSPVITLSKTVSNLSTGQTPALTVSPGQTLRYTISLNNTGPVAGSNIHLADDPDALNANNYPDGYFENSPAGTLRNITITTPASNNSQANGGVVGSGLLDLNNISIPPGGTVTVTYDIDVEDRDTPLPKAWIENQAEISLPGFNVIRSNITQTEITNIRAGFLFQKTVQDLSGDPAILVSGDTLRYTLRIRNTGDTDPAVGMTHAINSVLTDQIPANTRYIANSTTLNGAAITDLQSGVPPFSSGMLIHSIDVNVPGFMTANADPGNQVNVSTVTFDVILNGGLVNGTIISNQAILTGQQQALNPFTPETFRPQLSDDPLTVQISNDPTQSVLGAGVNLDALKTVSIISGADNIPDTGETLQYSITLINRGNATATRVRLQDAIPAGVSFVSGSVTLNGISIPDTGTSPLITGIDIASGSATPPLPTAGNGQLAAGETAIVTFNVIITATNGSLISNQGTLLSREQPDEPTDADGNDENGDQPTNLTVGNLTSLEITKEVVIVGGGVAIVNGQLDYLISVQNRSASNASNVLITDQIPSTTQYIDGSVQLNGFPANTSVTGNTVTASIGNLNPWQSALLRFRIRINPDPAGGNRLGDVIENTARVTADGGINQTDTAHIDIGGAPGVANLGGRVWDNRVHDTQYDAQADQALRNWQVRVYVNNANPATTDAPIAETRTGSDGSYNFNGLAPVDPNDPQGAYTLTFSPPDDPATYPAGSRIAAGTTLSEFGTTGLSIIQNINVRAGRNAQHENLPVESMGYLYNAITRRPVSGARVTLLDNSGTPLPQSCFSTPAHLVDSQQGQITPASGFYRFDLNHSNSNCPATAADYIISTELPDDQNRYIRNISNVIPPETATLDINSCPDGVNDRLPSPPNNTCEVQPQNLIPDPLIPAGLGTRYFLNLSLQPGLARLFHNHIPLDQDVGALVSISKQTPLKNVTRGQLVPYTITVTNAQNFALSSLEIRDYFPPGFKYLAGSATVNGEQREPETDISSIQNENLRAGTLRWRGLILLPQSQLRLKLILVVGAGVGEGEFINRAQIFVTGLTTPISTQASATVRVIPDPTFDCSDLLGKVFDDRNINGYQDQGETGIPGVRLATPRGLLVTTDEYGRFHIVCADVPNADRGSNFMLKLDERSLPSGYRLTTENPRVERITRGKITKFNFGATVHRVVRLDLADAAFVPNGLELREYWLASFDPLFEQLQKGPAVLRLSYLGDAERAELAENRLAAIRQIIQNRWQALSCCYTLSIETEIFWRRVKSKTGDAD